MQMDESIAMQEGKAQKAHDQIISRAGSLYQQLRDMHEL